MKTDEQQYCEYLDSFGLTNHVKLTDEEKGKITNPNDLPDGVYRNSSMPYIYYRIEKPKLTDIQISNILAIKKLRETRTIKGCIIFFVVIAIIEIIVGLVFTGIIHS